MCTGLFFGLAPMAQAKQGKLSDALKAAAGRTTASQEANLLRRIMVVAEVSLALVLLIGTGLMVRAFWKLQAVNAGVNPHGLLTMRVALPQSVYQDNYRLIQFWSMVQERLTRFPGVTAATMMSGMPPIRRLDANDTSIEGFVPRPKGPIQNVDYYQTVGKNFFETVGVRLVEGRFFDERDNQTGVPTVIINQTMARTFWPKESAIGHRVKPGGTKDYRTVVGVVGDVKNAGVDKPTGTELFLPYRQTGGFGLRNPYVVVRTGGDPLALATAARTQIGQIDSGFVANFGADILVG
jgi:putative ABC transport system permease protein